MALELRATSTSLSPQLTAWDRRVLNAVQGDGAYRLREIVRAVMVIGYVSMEDRADSRAEVLRTLRGLEHLGYVTHRNGWWRRALST